MKLLNSLGKRGFNEIQLRSLLLDYHNVIEFKIQGVHLTVSKDWNFVDKKENLKKGLEVLQMKIVEAKSTTYKIIAKNASEYHFIVPFDVTDSERVEVGQILSIEDKGLTFLARVTNIQHDSNYDGNWDTTFTGTQFFDQDQIFNRVIAEPLGCIHGGKVKKCKAAADSVAEELQAVGRSG